MAKRVPSLSVVLPAYNEEGNIEQAVTSALGILPELADSYEVVVVDDGSVDRTGEVVAGLAARYPGKVRLLTHRPNQGYGAALRTGLFNARSELVFYTDSDNQFDLAELHEFVPLAEQYDVVLGYRVGRQDPAIRCFLSWVYNRLVASPMFRVAVRDIDCSFKLFRRAVLDAMVVDCDDFFVDTELVARARKLGFRMVERGVRHLPRTFGSSTVRPSHIPRTLATVGRMWKRIYFPSVADQERAERKKQEAVALSRGEKL